MFTRKRKDYRTFIFTSVILALCLLIILIAWPTDPEAASVENTGEKANSELISEENQSPDSDGERGETYDEEYTEDGGEKYEEDEEDEADEEDNFPAEEKDGISGGAESYYLVKKAGEAIKVFFVDHSGNELELETTSIMYDMLSYDDQRLFDEGYKVKSQEELAVLLQDFES